MQILTEILTNFNSINNIILYGPNEILKNSEFYGKKLYRHGYYYRNLILSSEVRVKIKIFRFCEKINGKYKTYSLLPFYISPYQRYINTYIDNVLQGYFFEGKSLETISKEVDIGLQTVRRWKNKFHKRVQKINNRIEEFMIKYRPGYRTASYHQGSIYDIVKNIFKKVFQLAAKRTILLDYGVISWLNLKIN